MHGISFRGPAVCRLTGITYRQLDYWARIDFIRPSIANANGSGTQRRYSYDDVVLLSVVAHLRDAGVELDTLRAVMDSLRWRLTPSHTALVLGGSATALVCSEAELAEVMRDAGRVTTVVSLTAIREALEAQMGGGQGRREVVAAVG